MSKVPIQLFRDYLNEMKEFTQLATGQRARQRQTFDACNWFHDVTADLKSICHHCPGKSAFCDELARVGRDLSQRLKNEQTLTEQLDRHMASIDRRRHVVAQLASQPIAQLV